MPIPSPSTVLLRTQSDERLVLLARAGHERAFEAIVERYRTLLLRSARRYLPDARAEDALQQAYIAAWKALQRGDEVRDLRAWLYRIVHNTALNQLRSAGYDYAELEESLRGGAAPEEEMERRAVVRQTLTGLAALPERQREALLRIAVEGRTQEEVARELGVTEGAVRQLVHRARLTLRAAATALIPLPVASWAAAAGAVSGAGPPSAERIAELIAGAGASAFAVKAGTVAVIATTTAAVAGPTIVTNQTDPPARAARPAERAEARERARVKEPGPAVAVPTAGPALPRGEGAPSRGERSRGGSSGRRERDRRSGRTGRDSSGSGSGGSDSSGSGTSGSGSSGSDSSGSGTSGSGSSGSGSSGSGSSGSGSSGSGSSGSGSSDSGSSGSGSSGSGSSGSGSSGSGSSGSGSSGSGSSGSGSGESSGSGSGDSSGSDSSGSGSGDSSGSGSSGSDDSSGSGSGDSSGSGGDDD
jgi:RNA polymerase sigma factor (sigma-70 family)